MYKFVIVGCFDVENCVVNCDLFDDGIFYVVCFDVDGFVEWMLLIFGEGLFIEENGFIS